MERERPSISSAGSLSPRSPLSLAPLEGAFGVDIGGTLAKLVFLEKLAPGTQQDGTAAGRKRRSNFITAQERFGSTGQRYTALEFPSEQLGGVLHFIKFETRRLDNALKIVREAGLLKGMARVYMGGGGAFKYQRKIEHELGVVCVPVDEFEALVWGIDYVLQVRFPL
jgi:type II pantothenate kinase